MMEIENHIEFLINGEMLKLSIDNELYTDLMTSNANSINYINQLIVNKIIDVGALKELYRVEADGSITELFQEIEKENSVSENHWGEPETKLLLDKYEQYLSLVGPMKRFRSKRVMWKQIAEDIYNLLNIRKTEEQCENRYKTILKRKKKGIENNSTSGCSRKNIQYEEELRKITAQDDSIEPEVLRGPSKTIFKANNVGENEICKKRPHLEDKICTKKPHLEDKKQKKKNIVEVYSKIQKEKEENRERRHREKMELMEALINSIKPTKD